MNISGQKSNMEEEIFSQADILENLLQSNLKEDKLFFEIPRDVESVVLVASGSSYHCARYSADLFGRIANIEARAVYSSEFLLQTFFPKEKVLYVFITQSGETSDTNEALLKVKKYNIQTISITNKENSSIWLNSDYQFNCLAGEEKSIAATKSLTTQIMCCTLLVLKFAEAKGIKISNYVSEIKTVPQIIDKVYKMRDEIRELAKLISQYKNLVVTADGISYAFAKEASLKIKETSYLNVYSNMLGEFMHGHSAVLNNKIPHIHVLLEELSENEIKNLNKLRDDYNSKLCIVGSASDKIKYDYNLNIDCGGLLVKSFCVLVIIQMLALEIAKSLNRNVDEPHGLSKVVM